MKAFAVFLACLALPAGITPASAADRWDGRDKAEHVAVSAVLGTITSLHFEDKWTAFGVAMIPGVAKEIYDSQQKGNHFSGKDLTADALGAAFGVQFGHWMLTRNGATYRAAF